MLDIGTVLGGYRIEGLLGRGGMGVVYEATQLSLSRPVAFKVLAAELGVQPVFRERFRREALSQAALDHPNIVTVHEAGELEPERPGGQPRPFIAMGLVRGASLKDLIRSGELDPARTLAWLERIADALDVAHAHGLLHRDVKPQNILISLPSEHAYLSDFGLTKALGGESIASLTATGQLLGTPDYMSPEQVQGHDATTSSDVYALAAVVFECLTGIVPFPRDSPHAVLYAHVSQPPPHVTDVQPELGAALDAALRRGLAKDPSDRPASAGQLIEEAKRALRTRAEKPSERTTVRAEAPTEALDPAPAATSMHRGRGRAFALAGGTLAACALAAGGAVLLTGSGGGHCGDKLVMSGTLADDKIGGTAGADEPDALQGDDCITVGDGDDAPVAGAGNDTVYGGAGNDTLVGGTGGDTLVGEQGSDVLHGEAGDDRIRARDGEQDAIQCGPGNDTVERDGDDELVDAGNCEEVSPSTK